MEAHQLPPKLLLQTVTLHRLQRLERFLYQFPIGSRWGIQATPLFAHTAQRTPTHPSTPNSAVFRCRKGHAHTETSPLMLRARLLLVSCWPTPALLAHRCQPPASAPQGALTITPVVRDARYWLPCSLPMPDQPWARQLPIPSPPTLQACWGPCSFPCLVKAYTGLWACL